MLRRFEIQSETSENTKPDQQHSENHAAKLARLRAVHRLEVPDQSKHEPPVFEQQRRKQQDELKGVATIDYRHTDTPRLRGGTPTDPDLVREVMEAQQYQDCRSYWGKKDRGENISENEREVINAYNKFMRRTISLRERGIAVTKENILDDGIHGSYRYTIKHDVIYSFLPAGKKLKNMDEKSQSKYHLLSKEYSRAQAWAVKEYEKHGFPGLDEEAAIAEYTKTYLQTEVIERKQDEEASSSR